MERGFLQKILRTCLPVKSNNNNNGSNTISTSLTTCPPGGELDTAVS